MTRNDEAAATMLKVGTVIAFFVALAALGGPTDDTGAASHLIEETGAALGLWD